MNLHCVSPPVWELDVWSIGHREEDDNPTDSQPGIKSCGEHVVVLCPPGVEFPVNNLVEDQVDDVPTAVVDSRGWWDIVSSHKDERPVYLFDEVIAGLLPNEICHGRQDQPDPEEMQQAAVDRPNRVEASGANKAPDLIITIRVSKTIASDFSGQITYN